MAPLDHDGTVTPQAGMPTAEELAARCVLEDDLGIFAIWVQPHQLDDLARLVTAAVLAAHECHPQPEGDW